MDFDRIMQEITGGLTGDGEKDTRYLMEQMQKYRDHEMSREILRACGRLLYQCMPEEKKQAFAQAVNNNMMSHEAVLEEVRFKQHEKKYDEALALMEGLIRKIVNNIASASSLRKRCIRFTPGRRRRSGGPPCRWT